MIRMKRLNQTIIIALVFVILTAGVFIAGCATTSQPVNQTTDTRQKLVLATTTSLYDTGLLNYLEPKFESKYNVDLLPGKLVHNILVASHIQSVIVTRYSIKNYGFIDEK